MRTGLAAVVSRLVDVMNIEDPRPTTLLEGQGVEEILSSLSTVKIENRPTGSISRAVICDPIGRTIDAPYVIHDDAGLILLHLCDEKPEYLSSIARDLGKKGGSVRDASLAIVRLFKQKPVSSKENDIYITNIGISGNFVIEVSSDTDYRGGSNSRLLLLALEEGGITGHHLGGRYLPHEIGLSDFIKLENGCYPGQEIHARLDSRNPVTKRLVRIRSEVTLEKNRLVTEDGNLKIITPFVEFYAHGIADKGLEDGLIDHSGIEIEISTIHSAF